MKSSPQINIKLIQGLSLISRKEFREFIFFSTSKYFSGNRSYANILNLLMNLHKNNFSGYDNKNILEYLMAELSINRNTLLNRMSELYKIYEMFVVIRELKFLPFERNEILMNYYTGKGSFKLFEYVYNSSYESLKKEKISSSGIKKQYKLYDLSSTSFFMKGKSKIFTEHYSLRSEFHIFRFLLDILKNSIEIHQQKFMGTKQNTGMPEMVLNKLPVNEILEALKKTDRGCHDLIRIIYEMYLSFMNYSEARHFRNALNIHKKIKSSLSDEDNQYVYLLFITYCINQTHFRKPGFYKHLFRIIREKLNDGYFTELTENNFPVNNFRDYVFIGLRVGEIEWVRSFVKNYSHYLPPEYRRDDVLIAEGLIAEKERKYEEALMILNKVRKKNYLHYTDSSFNKLKAYYELRYYVEALVEIERIKKYFKSNKNIPEIFLKKYSPYLKDIEILFKYSEGKIDATDLKLYFKKSGKVLENNWVGNAVRKILKNQ